MKNTAPLALLALAGLVGCSDEAETLPPVGNHQLFLDTDAIVPAPLGAASSRDVPALFDRLEVAFVDEAGEVACSACSREFPVTEETFAGEGASLAVVPAAGAQPLVRVRLLRAESRLDGVLNRETVVEVVAQLPPTPAEGTIETTIFLPTDAVGIPRGTVNQPLTVGDELVRPGAPVASSVGTWPFAERVACDASAPDGAACIPGGAFWMGNPLVKGSEFPEADFQRLVVLSPYYIDEAEVTVADFRAWATTQAGPVDVVPHVDDPSSEAFFCTYTEDASEGDARPVNCVGYEAARDYCVAQGGALPTEAQFEYTAGALRSALFVWGQDELALCEGAVWGRGDRDQTVLEGVGDDSCLPADESLDGPLAVPADPAGRDATRLTDRLTVDDGATVFDLAGNLQEWALDYYHRQDEVCWVPFDSNVFFDPVCSTPGDAGSHAVRGGSWVQDRAFLRAAYRSTQADDSGATAAFRVGFRCAYPGTP